MFSLRLRLDESEKDAVIAELWDAGTSGITEESDGLRAFFDVSVAGDAVMDRFASWKPEFTNEPEHDWVAESQQSWEPFAVGERFYLVPEWRNDPAPSGRVRLRINPGMACGSGTHPATQLCLEALERHVREGQPALDVGTGSGILAQAACLLGADPVLACDIDHDASVIAQRNFAETPFRIPVFTGSLRSVRSRAVKIVIANLNAATLQHLAPEMKRVAANEGTIVVSGFRDSESERVSSFFGLPARERRSKEDYACLVL